MHTIVKNISLLSAACARYPSRVLQTTAYRAVTAKMSSSADRHERTYQLLDDNTTSKFNVHYNTYFFNHTSPAIYALDKLEAPVPVVERFVKWLAEEQLEPVPKTKTPYYENCEHYQRLLKEKYGGSTKELVACEFPQLSLGMIAQALHGMIHIGYGCAAKRDWFICEGLAYLKDIYLPFKPTEKAPRLQTLGLGNMGILDVINAVRCDPELRNAARESIRNTGESSTFNVRSSFILENHSDQVFNFVHQIKFLDSLNAKDFTLERLPELVKWLVDSAVKTYAIAETKNDFFLFHGITSAWALGNILPLLKTKEDVLTSVQTYLASLLVTYVNQGFPSMNTSLLKENTGMDHSWDDLVKQAVDFQGDTREHRFKIVQVCKNMSEMNSDPIMESLYRFAAHTCLTTPFSFVPVRLKD